MNKLLKNKKIILGVTGSIASYKAPLLVRELVKSGAHVNVIMTPSAKNFVTSTVLSNLSGNPVISEMFSEELQDRGAWHIQLAHWCDLMIIAPCSASTLSRLAIGLCDTALATITTALPGNVPLIIAPAMDTTMWEHPATQKNVRILEDYGAIIIPPEKGELSSGLTGTGRLPEIETILKYISDNVNNNRLSPNNISKSERTDSLADAIENDKLSAEIELETMKGKKEFLDSLSGFFNNKKIIISAGPTYEKIDDVRFIGNYSSGKMGFALAQAAQTAGANVTLISGPVSLETPDGVKRINVESAKEMYDAVTKEFIDADIAIMAAAVADYSPVSVYDGKMKKMNVGDDLTLKLQSTADILLNLGKSKKNNQKLIGFALESSDEINNGWNKMKAKNCDMIVVNSANKAKSGFGGNENTIVIITNNGSQYPFEAMSKLNCAKEILKKAALL